MSGRAAQTAHTTGSFQFVNLPVEPPVDPPVNDVPRNDHAMAAPARAWPIGLGTGP